MTFRFFVALLVYRLVLPLLFIAAFPGWLWKMFRRGGIGTGLGERAAIYKTRLEDEPCGQIHIHAISVGETLLALKLIREWRTTEPDRRFVLAVGTATGHAVGTSSGLPDLRVTYSPLDLPSMVRRYLNRFEPSKIVLIEGEAWPHLLLACKKRGIPVSLVNARLSPRSARRYQKFARWISPLFGMLDTLATQEPADNAIWQKLGLSPGKIHTTGSLKFDPGSGKRPTVRPEFQAMLDHFHIAGKPRPVVLVASSHIGEETWIATAIRAADPSALPAIVPRHAERRLEVKGDLERAGFEVILRSAFVPPTDPATACFVIDSTGELRDWTAHSGIVVIGKSFLSIGGQNPAEAILANKLLVFGPHMENFEPLSSRLVAADAASQANDQADLTKAVRNLLDPSKARRMAANAGALLDPHDGATRRIVSLISGKS